MASILAKIRNERLEKVEKLRKLGLDPYPAEVDKSKRVKNSDVTSDFKKYEGKEITSLGRIMSWREHGALRFAHIADGEAQIQIIIRKDSLKKYSKREENLGWKELKLLDVGDFISVSGKVLKSKTSEISIDAEVIKILSKSIRPMPEKWEGIKDTEIRYRKRYLDMLVNEDVKRVLDARWLIERETRKYLQEKEDFTEVETPILQVLYGGTNAKPFKTYMNALNSDFYLRVAPELYLKRLIVGGYERVFEFARNFRNEGIDQTHQPEFTMMEFYEAFADYHRIMSITEGLIKHLAKKLNGDMVIMLGKKKIDISGKWPKITMKKALLKYEKIDVDKLEDQDLKKLMKDNDIEIVGKFSRGKAIFDLFDKLCTPKLINPTWIIDYPKEVSPLSKTHRSEEGFVERFEGYIGGKEIVDGWSEIIDPIEQRSRFENEQKNMRAGDEEAHPLDEDFLESLEYGMPPLGGIGIGIDRLVMFLTNTWSIKDVIAFPTLRPKKEKKQNSETAKQKSKGTKTETFDDKESINPGIDREKGLELIKQYTKNENLLKHMYASEAAMMEYAKHFVEKGELNKKNIETWAIAGLVHDITYERDEDEHMYTGADLLKDAGVCDYVTHAIRVHGNVDGSEQETLLDKVLWIAEECTGLVVAATLVLPSKKLSDLKLKSLLKKWKDKRFAANINRENITAGCERIGMEVKDHLEIILKAMQGISDDLGL
jgi:lysyl-tRNA synthetase class 2